jgi:hypothetical protein
LAVDRPLQTVHPNRLWLGLKKFGNKRPSKMIHIEVILLGAFDSNHTSYYLFFLMSFSCFHLKKTSFVGFSFDSYSADE